MADSVAVFPAGYRLTDSSTGSVLSGAQIYFYEAGDVKLKNIYSDANLAVPLSNPVFTDSLGYPTSDGSTKTLIYVGSTSYKIVIKNSDGATIAEHDNVKGATVTTSASGGSVSTTRPVETKTTNVSPYSIVIGDQNKIIVGDCSVQDFVFTLPSATFVGSGWGITLQHGGSGNQVLVQTVSNQTISNGFTSFGSVFALSLSGEEVTLFSDGANWRCTSYVSPNIKRAQGVLTVAGRATAPAGGEVQGDLYIINGTPTGAWSAFANKDIVQFTNNAWVKFTPPENSGWIAFNKADGKNYQYRGTGGNTSWVDVLTTDVPTRASTPIALTAQTILSTSPQTNVDFTGIPSWAKRVTVLVKNLVNASGTKTNDNDFIFQLGVGTTPTNSGYTNNPIMLVYNSGSVTYNTSTKGFGIFAGNNDINWSGKLELINITGNTWIAAGMFGTQTTWNAVSLVSGHVDLGGSLGMIRLTTDLGTAGGVSSGIFNVLYE